MTEVLNFSEERNLKKLNFLQFRKQPVNKQQSLAT
jgi:hypothetical protein